MQEGDSEKFVVSGGITQGARASLQRALPARDALDARGALLRVEEAEAPVCGPIVVLVPGAEDELVVLLGAVLHGL